MSPILLACLILSGSRTRSNNLPLNPAFTWSSRNPNDITNDDSVEICILSLAMWLQRLPSRSPSELRTQWYLEPKRWTDADKLYALLEESGFRNVEKSIAKFSWFTCSKYEKLNECIHIFCYNNGDHLTYMLCSFLGGISMDIMVWDSMVRDSRASREPL